METTRLKVTLRDVTPRVIRVVDVPSGSTLVELHDLLQVSVGWTTDDAYQYVVREGEDDAEVRWGAFGEDDEDDGAVRPLSEGLLANLSERFVYHHHAEDDWVHDVEVLTAGDPRPGCVFGETAAPPEGIGGPLVYARMSAAADGTGRHAAAPSPDARDRRPDFDQAATDTVVRQVAGEVPASVRRVLSSVAEGLAPPTDGRAAVLQKYLRTVGLLKLTKGVLSTTRAAADDLQVLRRLRSWFEDKPAAAAFASIGMALLTIEGEMRRDDLLAEIFIRLTGEEPPGGWSTGEDGSNVMYADLETVLEALDMIVVDGAVRRAGPSALSVLPRAAVLADRWSRTTTAPSATSS